MAVPDDEQGPSRSDHAARWMIYIFLGALALLGSYLLYRWVLSNRIENRLEEIRRQGFPATLRELDDWYPEPPLGENAAFVYQKAFTKFVDPPPAAGPEEELPVIGKADLPAHGQPMPEDMAKRIADYLKSNAEAISLLYKAASMPQCRHSVDLTAGFTALLPHLSHLRHAARLLRLETVLCAENGDMEGAGRALMSSLAVGRSIRSTEM